MHKLCIRLTYFSFGMMIIRLKASKSRLMVCTTTFWFDDYEIKFWWLFVQKSWWGRECSNFSWFEQYKAQKGGKPAANSYKSSLSSMLLCYSWTNQNHPFKGFQIQADGMYYYFLDSCSDNDLIELLFQLLSVMT